MKMLNRWMIRSVMNLKLNNVHLELCDLSVNTGLQLSCATLACLMFHLDWQFLLSEYFWEQDPTLHFWHLLHASQLWFWPVNTIIWSGKVTWRDVRKRKQDLRKQLWRVVLRKMYLPLKIVCQDQFSSEILYEYSWFCTTVSDTQFSNISLQCGSPLVTQMTSTGKRAVSTN